MKLTHYLFAIALAFSTGHAAAQAVSALPAATTLTGAELTVAVQSGTTKKATIDQIKTWTSNAPTLVTPALGTPSSGTLTNATGLPISTGVSGLGTGVATFLGTPSSANFAAAITDETGTGAVVLASSPTLVTPALGVATATSINKVAVTAPATGATLTIADSKTLTGSNTLTFAGTDGSTLNVGTGGTLGTAAYTASSAYEASGAVSTHAALQTGVHGISITAGKTLSASNTLTLSGTDGSTLNVGNGGTLGTAAYTATGAYLPAAAINLAASGSGGVTGNLPVTNLNSGTGATSSTYWRGDGTWAAAGGGSVAIGDVTGLGTGVATALGIAIGSAGAPVVLNGAGGTPSSMTATNLSGTAASLTAGTVTTNANLTGDVTSSGNATTLATVNSNVGSFTNSSITVNGKGLVTAASSGAAGATLGANTFTALQTITQASANAGIIASTGYSLTGSDATGMINFAGTWNTTGNPVALNIAMTNTASGATTKFVSFLAGAGGATEVFSVGKAGKVQSTSTGIAYSILVSGQPEIGIGRNGSVAGLDFYGDSTTAEMNFGGALANQTTGLKLDGTAIFGWTSSTVTQSFDLTLLRAAAATLQQGAVNAASPVAQTLQAQGSRSGTDTNVAGANYTMRPGAGTGTAAPASFIIATYVPVASGTGAQTSTAALTLSNSLTLGSHVVTPASSGTRYLCIDTAGVVTSSASACSGA